MSTTPALLSLPLSLLHPHPLRATSTVRRHCSLLARHIAATGLYEPLIVRPHPQRPGAYELLHGHTRLEALRHLQHTHATCLLWRLSDLQALRWLATVHRLASKEKASRRLAVLTALLQQETPAALAEWVPEDAATLARLSTATAAPSEATTSRTPSRAAPPLALDSQPEAFTVFLSAAEKRSLLMQLARLDPNPALALRRLAQIG